MPNRTEARPAKAALTNATGRLPILRLFSTPLITGDLKTYLEHANSFVLPAPRFSCCVRQLPQ